MNSDPKTESDKPVIPDKQENKSSDEEISRLSKRVEEIRERDKSNLTVKKNREMKKEPKATKKELQKDSPGSNERLQQRAIPRKRYPRLRSATRRSHTVNFSLFYLLVEPYQYSSYLKIKVTHAGRESITQLGIRVTSFKCFLQMEEAQTEPGKRDQCYFDLFSSQRSSFK